jgi:hypothetical protein
MNGQISWMKRAANFSWMKRAAKISRIKKDWIEI